MNHPYSAFCGCNACEIEGHAQDNIADSVEVDELELEVAAREQEEWDGLADEPSF